MCVCPRVRVGMHVVCGQRQRQSVTARPRTTQCVCVCVCVCGVGGGGVRVGGGVFMGCVGRGDACVHAVWGWGGVWVCVWVCVVCRVCLQVVRAETERRSQAPRRTQCVCVGMHVGGVVCGRAETEKRAWMDIPHHSLVFPERVHHLRDPDHSRP